MRHSDYRSAGTAHLPSAASRGARVLRGSLVGFAAMVERAQGGGGDSAIRRRRFVGYAVPLTLLPCLWRTLRQLSLARPPACSSNRERRRIHTHRNATGPETRLSIPHNRDAGSLLIIAQTNSSVGRTTMPTAPSVPPGARKLRGRSGNFRRSACL